MKCKNCNENLKKNTSFCKNCGFDNNLNYNPPNESEFDKIESFTLKKSNYTSDKNLRNDKINTRINRTKYWQITGIIILITSFILGIFLGDTYKIQELIYESSIDTEFNEYEEVFNTILMLYTWAAGIVTYTFYQAINSICHRLDLLIDKK